MVWTNQQERALRDIREWLSRRDQQVFRLFGYAGTGKTTLTKEIASMVHGSICYGAFTGKAASVMRKKGCSGASTIHSMIYILERQEEGDPIFILNGDSEVKHVRLVVIDECSMVDETIGQDLLSFGTKILVIGDPAQLPPVKGAGFFTAHEPDFLLTEVHRQAADNPIIALSMKIRNGDSMKLGTLGESKIISRKDISQGMALQSEQIIVGLNKTRQDYNNRMRKLLNREVSIPCEGDKLICLRNDRKEGIFNGTMWSARDVIEHRDSFDILIESLDEAVPEKSVTVLSAFFEGRESELTWQEKIRTHEFTFGYAITCHKSQGSQWNDVTVFDESSYFRDNARRWLYTAVTRSAEKLTLVLN